MAEIPSLLTKAFAWIRVHPDEVSEAMEQRARQIADQFGKKFKAEEEEEEGQGNDDSDSSQIKKKKKKDKEKKKKKKKKGKGATAASTAFKILNGLSKPGTYLSLLWLHPRSPRYIPFPSPSNLIYTIPPSSIRNHQAVVSSCGTMASLQF